MCSNPQLTPVDARAPHNATRLLSLIVTSATRSENCADVRRDHTSWLITSTPVASSTLSIFASSTIFLSGAVSLLCGLVLATPRCVTYANWGRVDGKKIMCGINSTLLTLLELSKALLFFIFFTFRWWRFISFLLVVLLSYSPLLSLSSRLYVFARFTVIAFYLFDDNACLDNGCALW